MEFYNRKTGARLDAEFSLLGPENMEQVVECVKSEYGDTYFKQDFYDADHLRKMYRSGHVTFLRIALKNGGTAGVMALKTFQPEETQCEIASAIFKPEYRGFGICGPLLGHALKIAGQKNYSALYSLPVTFHSISQKLLERADFTATGFILCVFNMGRIRHSYRRGICRKHSQGIQILRHRKTDAGILYVPKPYRDFTKEIYRRLGVPFLFAEASVQPAEASSLFVKNDALQCSCSITVHTAGPDFGEKMDSILNRYREIPLETFNCFVNMNDPSAEYACDTLIRRGFFFTGLKPLCSEREFMILHHPNGLAMHFEEYDLTPEFREILGYIEEKRGEGA